MFKHGMKVMRGQCYDCAQGVITSPNAGFEYWDEEGDGRGFWFCRNCGSNQVTITYDDGTVVEQADLYNPNGFPNF